MNNKLLLLSVVLAGGLVSAHLISSLTVNASPDETIVKAEKEIVKKGYTFKVRNKAPGQGVSGVHAPSKNQAHQGNRPPEAPNFREPVIALGLPTEKTSQRCLNGPRIFEKIGIRVGHHVSRDSQGK